MTRCMTEIIEEVVPVAPIDILSHSYGSDGVQNAVCGTTVSRLMVSWGNPEKKIEYGEDGCPTKGVEDGNL